MGFYIRFSREMFRARVGKPDVLETMTMVVVVEAARSRETDAEQDEDAEGGRLALSSAHGNGSFIRYAFFPIKQINYYH